MAAAEPDAPAISHNEEPAAQAMSHNEQNDVLNGILDEEPTQGGNEGDEQHTEAPAADPSAGPTWIEEQAQGRNEGYEPQTEAPAADPPAGPTRSGEQAQGPNEGYEPQTEVPADGSPAKAPPAPRRSASIGIRWGAPP